LTKRIAARGLKDFWDVESLGQFKDFIRGQSVRLISKSEHSRPSPDLKRHWQSRDFRERSQSSVMRCPPCSGRARSFSSDFEWLVSAIMHTKLAISAKCAITAAEVTGWRIGGRGAGLIRRSTAASRSRRRFSSRCASAIFCDEGVVFAINVLSFMQLYRAYGK
jgi:hypothetical protein